MRGSRVLVTGGAGLVGSHLTDLLVREGAAEVVVLDDFSRGTWANLAWALANGPVRVIEADVRDQAAVFTAMRGADYVFHQAAMRITACAEKPRQAVEILVDGTYNVLEAAQAHGVRKVVAASSASVYGLANVFPTPEEQHPYNNRTIYGAAKVFNEGLLRSFNEMYGLRYVALRYFNVYGPRMDIHGAYTEVLIRWMERIAAGMPPVIFGDGLQTMDFIYIEDIARANLLAATSDVTDMVFNIASGAETSLRELASELCAVMGTDLEPEYQPERKVNAVPRRLADTGAAERYLGFRARVGLREGIRKLVSWRQDALVPV
jgi:UDP-glucose 4-epimerase